MWIKMDREAHFGNHIKIPEIGEPVEFSENGKANVTEQVADLLSSNIENINKVEKNKDETKNDNDEDEENEL
jgi:hypothetical protein